MTINRIDVMAVGPEVERLRWASDIPAQFMTAVIVRLYDSDGVEGIGGTSSYTSGNFDLSILEAIRVIGHRVLGYEALNHEHIWAALQDRNLPQPPGAVSAIDIAVWDLKAKALGVPLYELLGGARTRALAYASVPTMQDEGAYVKCIDQLLGQGFKAIKLHAWAQPDRDLGLARKLSSAYRGNGVRFMFDADQRYDRRAALRVARGLEELDYYWFEAPLNDFDVEGYSELRRRVTIPILPAGNWILNPFAMAHALRSDPWDAVRFDVTVAGGITAACKLLPLGRATGRDVELQSWGFTLNQAANLHVGLGLQHDSMFEQPIPFEPFEFGTLTPIRPDASGYVHAPTGDGLGVQLDWEMLKASALNGFSVSDEGQTVTALGNARPR